MGWYDISICTLMTHQNQFKLPHPKAPPKNWEKGLVTLTKISVCAVFVWSREIMFVHYQLLRSWHVKVVDSFQDHLKMETRLADFL